MSEVSLGMYDTKFLNIGYIYMCVCMCVYVVCVFTFD